MRRERSDGECRLVEWVRNGGCVDELKRTAYEHARKKSTVRRGHVGQWPSWMPGYSNERRRQPKKKITQRRRVRRKTGRTQARVRSEPKFVPGKRRSSLAFA